MSSCLWKMLLLQSHRSQSNDSQCKLIDWFLYDIISFNEVIKLFANVIKPDRLCLSVDSGGNSE